MVGRCARVSDLNRAEEAFAAFGEVLGPASQQAGIAPVPHVYAVHQLIDQGGRVQRATSPTP